MSAALKQVALVVMLAVSVAGFTPALGRTMSASRAAAIHECSAKAAKHKDYADETTHIETYRACMTKHRQPY